MKTTFELTLPTDSTLDGPRLRLTRQGLVVEYDHQAMDGTVQWCNLVFDEVLAVVYRDGSVCDAESIVGAREIQVSADSQRLKEVMARWTEAVGHHEFQQRKGGASRFRHFTVYFDDVGAIDVIATSVKVD